MVRSKSTTNETVVDTATNMGCIGKSRYVVVETKDSMALETSSNDNMIW